VVDTPKEALKAIKKMIPEGASVMNASAITFEEIGLTDVLKEGKHGWKNLHAEVLAESDQGKAAELRRLASVADYWLSSVSAVSEDGDLVLADLTGTRVSGFFSAKSVVVVVGAQKIVPTYSDAAKRTKKFTLAVESARVRVVYKAPASNVSNFVAIRSGNPYAPNRIHVIIVNDFLGY
jgi:L-lactate utilization protein LutB